MWHKVMVTTYTITQQLQYLAELIRYYKAPRQLRSCGENILQNSASVLNFAKGRFFRVQVNF